MNGNEFFYEEVLRYEGRAYQNQGKIYFVFDMGKEISLVAKILAKCDFPFRLELSQYETTIIGTFWSI